MYWYVQVPAGTYLYVLVYKGADLHKTWTAHFIWSRSIRPSTPTSLSRSLGLFFAHGVLPHGNLNHSQTTLACLAAPKFPQPGWPHTRCSHACHLQQLNLHSPQRNLYPWTCWTSAGTKGRVGLFTAHGQLELHKAGCRGRLIQFEHCSSLHRSIDGQIQLLKSVEKDQVEQEVIRTYFVMGGLGWRPPVGHRWQVWHTTCLSKEHQLYLLLYYKDREGPRE
jgi:hypothetical protein